MGEQNAKNAHTACSPIDVDRPKTKDPNRNPETFVVLPADEQREATIMDCPETTILMRLRQFQHEHLFDLGADLDKYRTAKYVEKVWWSFHQEFEDMPHKEGEKKVGKIKSEKDLTRKWAKVDRKNHLCLGHFLHLSENKPDVTDVHKYKVDGSFIPNSDRKLIRNCRPNWAYISFLLEFKKGGTELDPFDDTPGHDPDATAKSRRAVRGQIMSYAERVFAYQHRTAVFLLFVNGQMFRVMRWDRSGVIVTEAVNYVRTIAGTRALLEVTHALSKLDRIQQGLDSTAVRLQKSSCGWKRMNQLAQPNSDDLDHMERDIADTTGIHQYFLDPELAATFGALCPDGERCKLHQDPTHDCWSHRSAPERIPVFTYIRDLFRKSIDRRLPRYQLTVGGRKYLVGQHIFLGFGMVGRGTRGYVALDWETQRFVFLKDSWRPFFAKVEHEGAILSKLNAQNVQNVPTVLGYGDVYDGEGESAVVQETVTSQYHPKTGTRKVDWTIPPFEPPEVSAGKEEMETWVTEGLESRSKKDAIRKANTFDKPTRPITNTPQDVFRTAPPGPAFPPGPYKRAGPATELASSINSDDEPSPSKLSEAVTEPVSSVDSDEGPVEPRGTKRTADTVAVEDGRIQGSNLRHMVHTRLVEQEVCLPLTAFTSSRQFVRIILDCITAHGDAYQRCKYMHRDVSAGNLLILPRIAARKSNGSVRIWWRGLLADWELAKHTDVKIALQPQRTGTWHFMSAYLLSSPRTPATIADELESFLHILVYGAVRRMESNVHPIRPFLQAYFSGCDWNIEAQTVCCPHAKRESVVLKQTLSLSGAAIKFRAPGKPAEKHPINALISRLLAVFHSRYAVLAWETYSGSGSAGITTISGSQLSPRNNPTGGSWDDIFDEVPDFLDEETEEDDPPEAPQQPTPEMYANVKALATHSKILNLFYSFAIPDTKGFPENDVIPDRLGEADSTTLSEATATTGSKNGDAPNPDNAEGSADEPAHSQQADAPTPVAEPAALPQEKKDDVGKAEAVSEAVPAIVAPPTSRPTKRRRRDPVVAAEPVDAALPTGRMTRSRTAAMLAAAAAAPPPQDASLAQTTTRVTRSRSSKQPAVSGSGGAGAEPSDGVATKRGSSSRSNAVTRAAGGAGTGRRGTTARTRGTQGQTGGRRTRRS